MIKSRTQFNKKFPHVYRWLQVNGKLKLLNILGDPMHKPNKYWTYDKCLNEFEKYRSIKKWRAKSASSYVIAKNKGWIKIIADRFDLSSRHKWTQLECIQISSKFSSKEEWKKGHRKSLEAARCNGWILACTKHMKENACLTPVLNIDTGLFFKSIAIAAKHYRCIASNISAQLKGRSKTAGGYRWTYCDENGNILDTKVSEII